jgi:ankyrin repeat protein
MNPTRLISSKKYWILIIALGLCICSFANNESGINREAQQHFEKANELRKVADHDGAIAEYEKAVELSPKSRVAQDAQYWIGQSHFQAGRLDASLAAFQTLLDEHPSSAIAASTKQMIEQVQQAKQDYSLFEAVEKGDLEQLELLISKGADVNLKNQEGWTPLHIAAKEGHVDIAALLIKNRAEVNERINSRDDPSGLTPLHIAAYSNHVDVVELLIGAGAQINVHGTYGHTPLEYAAGRGDKDIVELLLAKGADIEAGDDWNRTPLLAAAPNNRPEIVKLLLDRGANVEARMKSGRQNALHMAASRNFLEVAKLLLKAGAYIDDRDMTGQTPLHKAVMKGHQDMVELLLDNGAFWRHRHLGIGLIGLAMAQNQGEMVKFLVDKGLPNSPVHVAAFFGDINEVKSYLDGGGDINEYSPNGFMLLLCAINGGRTEVAELLIKKGANTNRICFEGGSALEYAAWKGRTGIARMLLDNGAEATNGALHAAVSSGRKDILEMLIAKGADVNGTGFKEELSVRRPGPPDYKFDRGWTNLHTACYHTNPPWRKNIEVYQAIVEVLVTHGADVNAKTKNGRTPISLLKISQDHSHNEKLIELLRKHGAKE